MRILVVDDEPLIRLGLASLVEEWGYEAIEASDAAGAIRWLEKLSIDFIITDVDMPGSMDGLELARYVSERWPPIKIIVVSGKVSLAEAALPEGARFLSKPYRDDALHSAVRDLHQK